MKSIHKILTLMYERYISDISPYNPYYYAESFTHPGLCAVLKWVYYSAKITKDEYDMAKEYLYKNKPKKLYGSNFFWEPNIRRCRLRWLVKHMELTK